MSNVQYNGDIQLTHHAVALQLSTLFAGDLIMTHLCIVQLIRSISTEPALIHVVYKWSFAVCDWSNKQSDQRTNFGLATGTMTSLLASGLKLLNVTS